MDSELYYLIYCLITESEYHVHLIPWPGPDEIFLIQTLEVFLTMEMQSSPEMEHNAVKHFASE